MVKQKKIKIFLRKNKVSVIAISEHRVQNNIDDRLLNKLLPRWRWSINASTNIRGRLWVIWDPNEVVFQQVEIST